MQIYFSLLLSLALHAALIAAPISPAAKPGAPEKASLEARLMPPVKPTATAEAVSSEADSPDSPAVTPRLDAPPGTLRGHALHRAQTALSEHLFYPPQAIAQGLEGDVVLLLILADGGRLLSASVARSSGHALLDQAALDAALSLGALPGNPRQTMFPVSFRLQ